jgi:hypothetical protein
LLVAIAPRMYREAFVRSVRNHRPDVEVEPCPPEDLERKIALLEPHLFLVCHDTASEARKRVADRIEISLTDGMDATVFVDYNATRAANIGLDQLFAWVDEIVPLEPVS